MPDIRLSRPQTHRTWLWIGVLAALGLLVYGFTSIFGDPTDPAEQPQVGAAADVGAERAPILPMRAVPLAEVMPLQSRDLGRLVRLDAVSQSRLVDRALWVRTATGHRILVRFEPAPPEGRLSGLGPGSSVDVVGYVDQISRAEFRQWADTLGIALPSPPKNPTTHFGYAPRPEFARLDSLFVRNFYISVRPEGLDAGEQAGAGEDAVS